MAITTQLYVGKLGNLLECFAVHATTGRPVNILTAPVKPTLLKNGVPVVLYGPVWTNTSFQLPFVAYSFPGPSLPTDVFTYSAPAGWITTASGNAPAASGAGVANHTGQLEPGVGGVPGFNTPASGQTMPVGMGFNFPPGINYLGGSPFKNWAKRLRNPWYVGGTGFVEVPSDADGRPLAANDTWIPSTYLRNTFASSAANGIDGKLCPVACGRWTVVYDETASGGPDGVEAMSFWVYGSTSAGGVETVAAGPRVVGVRTVVGTTVTITYDVTRALTTSWSLNLTLACSSPNGGYTADDLWIFAPGNTIDRSNATAIDDTLAAMLTSPSGKTPVNMRFMAQCLNFGGNLNCVNAADLRNVDDYTWFAGRPATIDIVAVRYYNTNPANATYAWSSPNVYCEQFTDWTDGPSGTDAVGAYVGPLTSASSAFGGVLAGGVYGDDGSFLNLGGVQSTALEFRCTSSLASLGLRTSDQIQFPNSAGGSPTNLALINGGTISLSLFFGTIWQTGTHTFACFAANTTGAIAPAIQRLSATAEIALTFTEPVTISRPEAGVIPFEFIGSAAAAMSARPYVNLGFGMTDACITEAITRVASTAPAGSIIEIEMGNEIWNGFSQTNVVPTAFGRLFPYLPVGHQINQYYATTGVALNRTKAGVLRAAQAHVLAEAVLGIERTGRIIGVQWDNVGIANNAVGFASAQQIPVSAIVGADYSVTPNESTINAAFSAAGGNWSSDQMNEFARHYTLYSSSRQANYSLNYAVAQSYSGPSGYALQVGGRPVWAAYEAGMQKIAFNTAANHDCWSRPSYADVQKAFYLSCQTGNPFVPGSGFVYATAYEYGFLWDGSTNNALWSLVIWQGQQPGTGLGTTNTSQSVYAGIAPTTQQYITAQGGAPADGAAHDVSNDSVSMYGFRAWLDNSNAVPTGYFVAPILTSGSGSLGDPWGIPDLIKTTTIPYSQGVALTTLVPGDTLYFRAGDYHVTGEAYGVGNYNSQLISPTQSGTLSQPITLRAYPGETARLIVDGNTDQPLFGSISPSVSYVRFLGFWIEAAEGHTAFNVKGNSIEISYCDIKGKYHAGGDNHESIALTDCFDAWVHHNDIHDLTGDNLNSVGIKLYRGGANLIEDNYIHDCQGAINDKDGGNLGDGVHVTTYRRNWFVNNVEGGFHGSNQGDQATFIVYDNVMNDRFELVLYNNDSQVYNNLFNSPDLSSGGLSVCVTADVGVFRSQFWNNVWFPTTSLYFGYNASNSAYVASGPTAEIAYMDYNVYAGTGVPQYVFVGSTFTLAQWRAQGHEISSMFPAAPTDVYVDLVDYVLETAYETAGRYGDPVGPRYPIVDIMDVARYGPGALAPPPPTPSGTGIGAVILGTMTVSGIATASPPPGTSIGAIILGAMTAAGTATALPPPPPPPGPPGPPVIARRWFPGLRRARQ